MLANSKSQSENTVGLCVEKRIVFLRCVNMFSHESIVVLFFSGTPPWRV